MVFVICPTIFTYWLMVTLGPKTDWKQILFRLAFLLLFIVTPLLDFSPQLSSFLIRFYKPKFERLCVSFSLKNVLTCDNKAWVELHICKYTTCHFIFSRLNSDSLQEICKSFSHILNDFEEYIQTFFKNRLRNCLLFCLKSWMCNVWKLLIFVLAF